MVVQKRGPSGSAKLNHLPIFTHFCGWRVGGTEGRELGGHGG